MQIYSYCLSVIGTNAFVFSHECALEKIVSNALFFLVFALDFYFSVRYDLTLSNVVHDDDDDDDDGGSDD